MKIIKSIAHVLMLLLLTSQARGNIDLPWLLGEGAVLQRGEPIPMWGTAPADTMVEVTFAGETHEVKADQDGNWQTEFSARKAGGPYEIHITSGPLTKTVKDVLIGDVWVCSGQSNMEWVVSDSDGATAAIASANSPYIRQFKVPRSWAVAPSDTLAGGEWLAATPKNLGNFTGVGWYFAKRIHGETGVPIGLINTTWGGSRIEAWMSPTALGVSPTTTQNALAELVKTGEARAREVKHLLSRWPGALVEQINGGDADWSAAQLDERDWLHMQVPGLWESQQLAGVDGIVWYRKSFSLTQAEADAGITLGLGRIDDKDITWVNGHKIGSTSAYDEVRTYSVPAEYLQPGQNHIAIRVDDTGGGGGIYSSADLVYVQLADGTRRSLAGEWKLKADKVTVAIQDNMHHTATALYNKMLHPLFKIPVTGVLWYQGESNANTTEDANVYRQQFPAMIKDWRAQWHSPELAFYWVQLANFISGHDSANASPWAIVRESQTAALDLANTGQAITIDIGNPDDIHPTDKKTVGERLALIALNKTYRQKKVELRGPVFQSVERRKNELVLQFTSRSELAVRNQAASVKGFEIAGKDGVFTPVDGVVKNNKVILPLRDPANATAVRYAWSDNPEHANLINASGLPAEPFRADL